MPSTAEELKVTLTSTSWWWVSNGCFPNGCYVCQFRYEDLRLETCIQYNLFRVELSATEPAPPSVSFGYW